MLRQPLGQRILRYASLDDIAIWGVLALILLDWDRVGRQAAFLIGFAAATWLARRLMARIGEDDRWHASLIWLAAAAASRRTGRGCTSWSARSWRARCSTPPGSIASRLDRFRHFVLLAVMPVFFLSTGLRRNGRSAGSRCSPPPRCCSRHRCSGSSRASASPGGCLKWPKGEATTIGWLLQTKALIMISFVNILLDKGIVTNATFTALLLMMAVASTMLTVCRWWHRDWGVGENGTDKRSFSPPWKGGPGVGGSATARDGRRDRFRDTKRAFSRT